MSRGWLGERFQNDLFCVEWDVKAQLNQSVLSCEILCTFLTHSGQRPGILHHPLYKFVCVWYCKPSHGGMQSDIFLCLSQARINWRGVEAGRASGVKMGGLMVVGC